MTVIYNMWRMYTFVNVKIYCHTCTQDTENDYVQHENCTLKYCGDSSTTHTR